MAQIYHIDEHYPTGFLLWAVGALALAWILESIPHALLATVLLAIWGGAEVFHFHEPNLWALLLVTVGVAPLAWRKESALLLATVLAAVELLLIANVIDYGGSARAFTSCLGLGVLLIGAARLTAAHRPSFSAGAGVMAFFGFGGFFFCAYLLGFHEAPTSCLTGRAPLSASAPIRWPRFIAGVCSLSPSSLGAGSPGSLSRKSIFIRGSTENFYGQNLQVRYGIEALFMQQGAGKKLEELRTSGRPGVPLDIEVALSSAGVAVLKSYQWESLGITLAFERAPAAPRSERNPPDSSNRGQFITALKVELKNHGPQDAAIVDLPDAGSFRLVTNDRGQESRYRWVGEARPAPAPAASHVIVLKPGETHATRIDLLQPDWFVVNSAAQGDDTPIPLRDVADPWSASFRIEYAPPSKDASSALPHSDLILHRPLRSRAFNPTVGMD